MLQKSHVQSWLVQLGTLIANAVQQVDNPQHPIFSGCYDWHSAVHGHWALLRIDQLLSERTYSWIGNRFTVENIRSEGSTLLAQKNFEMPYGRTWLLRLACTFETYTNSTALRQLATANADLLIQWLQHQQLTPCSKEYNNHSWVLMQLYDFYEHYDVASNHLADLIRSTFQANYETISPSYDHQRYPEFFSRWANQALLLHKVFGPAAVIDWLEKQDFLDTALRPITSYNNAHHLGCNLSRAWGLWSVYQSTQETKYLQAYEQHILEAIRNHQQYAADYWAYGHWVPQFAVYAIKDWFLNEKTT